MKETSEIISVILLSALKMGIGGVPLSFAFKFPLLKAITTTTLGGCIGSFTFVYLSDYLIKLYYNYFPPKPRDPNKVKKKFTFTNKLMVKIKRKYGLFGVAFVTPLFLSFPFGCFVAVRYFKDKRKITAYMMLSTVFWSVALSLFKMFFH